MKRIFCFLLTFCFLFIFLVSPVHAAQYEAVVYEFYRLPDIVLYGDGYDFYPDFSYSNVYFVCDQIVRNGVYELWVDFVGVEFSVGNVHVVYSYDEVSSVYFYEITVDTLVEVDDMLVPVSVRLVLLTAADVSDSVMGVCEVTLPDEAPAPAEAFRLVSVSSSHNQFDLDGFLSTLSTSFVDLGVSSLAIVLVAPLVICSGIVLCWFGYRFIKRKILSAVKKGKL